MALAYGLGPLQKLTFIHGENKRKNAASYFPMGGNWDSGERGNYAFAARSLAARGIIMVTADYRLYPEVQDRQILADAADAVVWTAREVGVGGDVQQLFVMGQAWAPAIAQCLPSTSAG